MSINAQHDSLSAQKGLLKRYSPKQNQNAAECVRSSTFRRGCSTLFELLSREMVVESALHGVETSNYPMQRAQFCSRSSKLWLDPFGSLLKSSNKVELRGRNSINKPAGARFRVGIFLSSRFGVFDRFSERF